MVVACKSPPSGSTDEAATSEVALHRGMDHADKKDHAAAVKHYDRAIKKDARNAQAHHERGMSLLELGKNEEAVASFTRALKIDSKFPGSRSWRANTLMELERFSEAAKDRLLYLEHNPDGPHEGMGVAPTDWYDCAEASISE